MKKKLLGVQALMIYLSILIVIAAIVLVNSILFSSEGTGKDEGGKIYSRHYALITESEDDEFWNQVYESARDKAMEADTYVEWFGRNLSGSYSVDDMIRMAVNAGVDGIILQPSESEETQELINKSVKEGIPVVTVLSDCQESSRQAYVGVNNYDIGQLYGQEIMNLIFKQFTKNISIMIAVSDEQMSSAQNLTLMGIREYVNDHIPAGYYVNIETELIQQDSSFATEEYFNKLFVSSQGLPNILICLDERGTRCSYLAAVDHNRVGETSIIGYYYSNDILSALEKGVLDSILSVDAAEMGSSSVETLLDYQEYGHTNSYKTVKVQLLGQKDAADILQSKNQVMEETE